MHDIKFLAAAAALASSDESIKEKDSTAKNILNIVANEFYGWGSSGDWDMPFGRLPQKPFELPEEMNTKELQTANYKIMVAAELEEQQKIERAIAKRAKKNKSKL